MPYINTIDINGVVYTLENLTDGKSIVTLPTLSEDDIFVLRGNIVNNTSSTSTTQPLSAYQGKVLKDALEAEITNRTNDVNLEETRATTAENTLTTNLNSEITRAKAAEKVLTDNLAKEVSDRTTAVSAEKSRAESAESTLTTNLNNEITRAKAAEQTLTTNLSTEVSDRKADVDAEEARAKGAEKTLTDNLSAEVTRATNKENEINTAITNEVSRATGAENTLTSNLNAEIDRAKAAEGKNATAISTEKSRAEGVESDLASRIATMEAFFKEADIDASKDFIDTLKEIQGYIASDKTGAAAMTASIQANKTAIETEKSRAEGAEGTLQSNIDAEAATARAAEQANADAIAVLNGSDEGSVAKAVSDAKTMLEAEIAKKVDNVDGKGLSDENYTSDEKTKLEGIADGANKYEHPIYDVHESGLYKITVDEFGHISDVVAVSKDDIVELGIPAQDTTYEDATAEMGGLLSSTDKATYDGYATTIADLQSQIDALRALIESYHGVVEDPEENPEEPADPETPVDPEEPVEPETPEEQEPTEPEQPEDTIE